MKTNSGEPQAFRQCLATSRTGKAATHHRCRLPERHTGEHLCVVNGCTAGWRS